MIETKKGKVAFGGDRQWLSNMYQSPIIFDGEKHNLAEIFPQFEFDGLEYGSSEHLYQSLKSTNEEDKEKIRTAETPNLSKIHGREIFPRMDWGNVKIEAMRLALFLKFSQHKNLMSNLIRTQNEPLVEVNYWGDTFWGVCDKTNVGENWLGRLLMELRSNSVVMMDFIIEVIEEDE